MSERLLPYLPIPIVGREDERYRWLTEKDLPQSIGRLSAFMGNAGVLLTRVIWVKPSGEMPFLYGGNIVKAHVGRLSEDCPEHQGVVVFSMSDAPLGFVVTPRSTAEAQ